MLEKSDAQLLHDYAEGGDETAFREIVSRHTDLIYSAALRQVASHDLACDVAQSVFTDLARKAAGLSQGLAKNASLSGWLYRGTRYAALRLLRDDRRRLFRERQVMQELDAAPDSATEWDRIQPLLDEAMNDLTDDDREALLLRYFKNHDFRAIGASLGVSDDTAQKRVSRALEKLRASFTRRGVTTTALALSTTLSSKAVSVAPAGLAASLSNAALAGKAIAAVTTATKAIAMTTLQKTLVAVTLVVVAGAGFYEARRASVLRGQMEALEQQQQSSATQQLAALQHERDAATNQVAALLDQIESLKKNSSDLPKLRREVTELRSANVAAPVGAKDSVEAAAKSWADRVTQLKARLAQTPGASIPEMTYLKEGNWLSAARDPLETEKDYRRAFSSLRSAGENQFIISMQSALDKYRKENPDQFPSDLSQLKPYFEGGVDDAMLERYTIVPASSIPNMKMGGDQLITVKDPIDEEFDSLWALGPQGFGSTNYRGSKEASILAPAVNAYKAANNGKEPNNPADIEPYLTTPQLRDAYQKLLSMRTHAGK